MCILQVLFSVNGRNKLENKFHITLYIRSKKATIFFPFLVWTVEERKGIVQYFFFVLNILSKLNILIINTHYLLVV